MIELQDFDIIYARDFCDYEEEEEKCPSERWSLKYDLDQLIYRPDNIEEKEEDDEVKTILTSSSGDSKKLGFEESESVESLTHPCLKAISISDSQLQFLNLYNFFPVPKDPGLRDAFWILYPSPPDYAADGIDKFHDLIDIFKLAPIGCLKKQLKSDTVDLSYFSLDSRIIQPLCQALIFNTTVQTLNLKDNIIPEKDCFYLNNLLLRNSILSSLDLSYCKIGSEGARRLIEGISISSLRHISLRRCDLHAEGFSYIAKATSANALLLSLDVSDNNLDENSADHISYLISNTDSLKKLNLSWNNLYSKDTCEKMFKALIKNTTITDFDLSWNAMNQEGIFSLTNFIINTKTVERLNLEANCFSDNEVLVLAKAIVSNNSLKEILLSQNLFSPKGIAEFIIAISIDNFVKTPLHILDLENFWTTKNAIPALDQLKILKPNLNLKLGGILENFLIIGPDLRELFFKQANFDAMNQKNKKERKNFGHFILSLNDEIIPRDGFEALVKQSGIKLSENLINEIAKQFLVTRRMINLQEMKVSYLSYFPDTKLPLPQKLGSEPEEEEKGLRLLDISFQHID
ncbi:leucine-rich repeat-containing protein 74B-like [Trichogramma pretiosum]|uniref:leucine-rich repeat-containing protein 74B-like n=1 Tax=Trichogramma pretiosum TaxID=7493 RepID=UPI0006C9C410|nr:leucine-rich repeat-containing protein 74B-like [Trichogramma pretiosum]